MKARSTKRLLLMVSMLFFTVFSFAQQRTVTGEVFDQDGNALPNVSYTIQGTQRGGVTDAEGSFSVVVSGRNPVLVFTEVNHKTVTMPVGDQNHITVTMERSTGELQAVVVTALGIKRESRSLGYAVTEVKGSDLTKAREINVANSLEGRVPGLNVSGAVGGPGASSNVIIRGISSLGSGNQPLYVVNGIPMENNPQGQPGTRWDNGVDLGDDIGNINPDDIQSITVLKGAAASALYGYRAKAGVILITTKQATTSGLTLNSNLVAENIIDNTHFQYKYGQGGNNQKPQTQIDAFNSGQSSFGGLIDGTDAIQFDGVSRPYVAQRNNLKDFYRTGYTITNTMAWDKTFTGGGIRFSANDVTNQAVIPNSGLDRQSFDLSVHYSPIKRLTLDVRSNYILEQAKNRPFLSDGPGNSNYNVMFLPTTVDVNVLKKATNPNGSEYAYSGNTFATNPWFAAEKFINNTDRERLLSSAQLKYTFDNGLFVQGRVGRDAYFDRYTGVVPTGTAYRPNGSIEERSLKFNDINVDGLAGMDIKVTKDFTVSPSVGASYRRTKSEAITNNGANFAVPFVYTILNANNKSVAYGPYELVVQSTYGMAEFNYKDYLYLTGTVRSDWFSSLASPGFNNKLNVVYPSVSGSFVFSQFTHNNWLNFGKLRAGYAVVGNATDPYQTQLSYNLNSVSLNGLPLGSIDNSSVPNAGLRASKASEFEVGTDLRMFNNRLTVDLSYYNKLSKDEILPAPASITSGYGGAVLNIGRLRNSGVEAMVSYDVFRGNDFTWTTSVNGSYNDNKVLELAAGQSQLQVGQSRSGNAWTANIVGQSAVQIMAFDYKYDNSHNIVIDPNTNAPAQGDLVPWGSAYAKWIGGWINDFRYKRFNMSFLIDGKWGGKIFSATDYYAYTFGLHQATLDGRADHMNSNFSSIYYANLANNVSKLFVLNANFIKFRQITFGYTFPTKMFNNVVKELDISLVGRNLFTIHKKTDNIDPEASFAASSGGLTSGLELGGVPAIRSYGVNIRLKF